MRARLVVGFLALICFVGVSVAEDFDKAAFEKCIRSTKKKDGPDEHDCFEQLTEKIKGKPAAAFAAAKYIRSNYFAYVSIPFFHEAVLKKSKEYCQDSELENVLVATFNLPKDNELVSHGKAVAFELCWPEHEERLVAELESKGQGSYVAQNVCDSLQKKKALPKDKQTFCSK